MRWPTIILAALLVLLQYPLWFGKGGWLRVWEVDRQLQDQRELNQSLEQRNAAMEAEVRDLKTGFEAIEEPGDTRGLFDHPRGDFEGRDPGRASAAEDAEDPSGPVA